MLTLVSGQRAGTALTVISSSAAPDLCLPVRGGWDTAISRCCTSSVCERGGWQLP